MNKKLPPIHPGEQLREEFMIPLGVRGELMVKPRSVSGKGRGNAAATRKNQAEHGGEGAYQSAPPGFCRRGTDERDFRCNRS